MSHLGLKKLLLCDVYYSVNIIVAQDQCLNTGYMQYMPIYLGDCCLYHFDRQRAFKARYMIANSSTSQEYGKHDENNVEHRDNTMAKS